MASSAGWSGIDWDNEKMTPDEQAYENALAMGLIVEDEEEDEDEEWEYDD